MIVRGTTVERDLEPPHFSYTPLLAFREEGESPSLFESRVRRTETGRQNLPWLVRYMSNRTCESFVTLRGSTL